jgi:hypothetical protein
MPRQVVVAWPNQANEELDKGGRNDWNGCCETSLTVILPKSHGEPFASAQKSLGRLVDGLQHLDVFWVDSLLCIAFAWGDPCFPKSEEGERSGNKSADRRAAWTMTRCLQCAAGRTCAPGVHAFRLLRFNTSSALP